MNFDSLLELCQQQIWQLSALILAVGIVAPFVGRRRPHFAYLLWLLVFIKCVTPPLFSSPASVFSWWQHSQETAVVSDEAWHEIAESPVASVVLPVSTEIQSQPQAKESPTLASPSPPIGWQSIAFFVWLSGAVSFGLYLSVQWLRMTRIIRRNAALTLQNERAAQILATTSKSLGISRPPKLVVVSEPLGPAAIGCLRPTIVLPTELVSLGSDTDLESIFTHELTHIRRGDVGMAWLQALASCVWWFHPLVWYANRQIVRWREAACDEEVIARLSISPRTYADALLRVMESRVRPFPAMQVGMAVGESTQTRLVRLMKQTNPCRQTPIWCWAAAILLGLAVLPGGAFSVAQQADFTFVAEGDEAANADVTPAEVTGTIQVVGNDGSEPADNPVLREELAINIKSPDKQPNEIAEIKVAHIKDGKELSLLTATSVDGIFSTPKRPFVFDRSNPGRQRVIVMGRAKDGSVAWKEWHVMGHQNIQLREGDTWDYFLAAGQSVADGEREPLRADVRFAKEHVDITGNVRDSAGKPVANANVALTAFSSGRSETVPSPSPNDTPNTVYGSAMSPPMQLPKSMQLTTKTDANGNWTLGKIAKGRIVTVNVSTPKKPDVLTKIVASSTKTEITLPQSRDASVTVVDKTTGNPVGNVSVRATVQLGQTGTAIAVGQTNEQGQVQLNLPLGKNTFAMKPLDMGTATHYPSLGQSTVDSATGSISLKMDPATQIEFLVFDEGTGKPLPFLKAQPTQDSGIDHRIDNSRLKQGITLVTCKSGKATFHIPGLAYRGYELLNPIEKPMELLPGQSIKYTFRVRKMKEYRLPVDDDSLHLYSAAHQAAVKKLRELGAHVTSRGNPNQGQGYSSVWLTQFWKGTAEDLSVIGDLQHLQQLDSLAYPVPKEFRTKEKPQAPIITDEYLKQFGKAKEVPYIHIKRDNFTDKGIAHLAGCKKLQNLWLHDTTIRGEGFQTLGDIPLSSLNLHGPNLDFTNVDLSNLKMLNEFTLKNTSGVAVIPPKKVGRGVVHVNINPANQETLDRLNEYENLQFVLLGGETVNDELLKHALLRRIQYLQLTKDCKVTNEGLANLADANSKLLTLTLEGEQFTDDAVPHLAKLSGLRDLQLQGVSITDAGLKKLKTALPELNLRTMSSPSYQYQVVPD